MGELVIVHVITRLLRAGSEENVIATCIGQAERGHNVILVHGRDYDPSHYSELGDRIRLECAESLVQPLSPVSDVAATRQMTRLFKAIGPDIVHTHQSKAGILGRVAARAARVPHIVHGVHIAPFVNVGRVQRATYIAAEKMTAKFTHAFVSVSRGMKDAYLHEGIGQPDRHHVVYSGMPLEAFLNATPPDNWRELAGVPESAEKPPILVMLAALEPRKRHRELIKVFGRVTQKFPDARLLLAGEGCAKDDILEDIKDAGLEKNVRLLGFHSEPGRLVALADVCLLTSMREGLPRVVVQYIAGGKPVIVTRVPGIEEIVEDGVSGFITDPEDLSDTADAIIKVLSDRALLSQLADGAAAKDVSQWQTEALVEGTEKVYAALVAVERRAPIQSPT